MQYEEQFMSPKAKAFFREQERKNQRLMAFAKFGLIAVFFFLDFLDYLDENASPELVYSLAETAAFLPVAFAQLWLSRQKFYWPVLKYVFLAADMALIAYIVMVISPYSPVVGTDREVLTILSFYRDQEMNLQILLLSWVLLNFSVRFLIWYCICVIAAWLAQAFYVTSLPGTFTANSIPVVLQQMPEEKLKLQPMFIDYDIAAWNIQLIIILTIGLSFVIISSRKLVMEFYKSQLQRNILSRYFSPSVVDRLIDEGVESLPQKKSDAAILFVDIVGFTSLCERISPEELLLMLQEFHAMLEELVFEHGGNMEKYIGDALMASFGVPEPCDDVAGQTFACACDMLKRVENWNVKRRADNKEPVEIGIGLSWGETISGTIGHGRNMAFVVVGQTVNLASRLQAQTRKHKTRLIVSEAFYRQIADDQKTGCQLVAVDPVRVKGFHDPVKIRILEND